MNVFFTTPYAGKRRYQPYIDRIVEVIKKDNNLITPEDTSRYLTSLGKLKRQGLTSNQAHYAFIRQGIASADVVIIEASEEDIRVGHEMTLALLFHKPTLILSQHNNFSEYIAHDLLQGAQYTSLEEIGEIIHEFLKSSQIGRADASMQTLHTSADSLHSIALAKLRQLSKQEPGEFGKWARDADKNPKEVAKDIENKLGTLKKQPPWSVFAPIYNEDSPDYIQSGVARFVRDILQSYRVQNDDLIVEAACGTAALSRQLSSLGCSRIKAFDNSRPMLSEAFKLSTNYPNIGVFESDINSLELAVKAKAIIWTDYSSNFALTADVLKKMLAKLLENLTQDGILLFDVRTFQGWQIDFYAKPITTFATERFQRIWLNRQDVKSGLITFDVFIRTRDVDGAWSAWKRESMTEYMWHVSEVVSIITSFKGVALEAVYQDDFRKINTQSEEPNLAYFVLKKLVA